MWLVDGGGVAAAAATESPPWRGVVGLWPTGLSVGERCRVALLRLSC